MSNNKKGDMGLQVLQRSMKSSLENYRRALANKQSIIDAKQKLLLQEQNEMKFNELSSAVFREKHGEHNEHRANSGFNCSCAMCQLKEAQTKRSALKIPFIKEMDEDSDSQNQDFPFLLKKLLPVKNNAKSLKLLIPDTVVFQNGEPIFIIYNSRDQYVRSVRQKERLTLTEIKKFLQERRKTKDIHNNLYNETTITIKNKLNNRGEEGAHEQSRDRASSKDDSFIDGDWREPVEDVKVLNPKKKREMKRIVEQSNATKDAVLIHYKDDSIQVLSELDFSYFMIKRKIEAIWKEITYMQLSIKLASSHSYLIRVEYALEKDSSHLLYQKALDYVLYLKDDQLNEVHGFAEATEEDYYEESLKNKNMYEYCQYSLYKVVHYIEAFTGTKICKMVAEFGLEQATNLVYLVNANKISFKETKKDYVLRKIYLSDAETRERINNDLNGSKKSFKNEILTAFQEFMVKTYGHVKATSKITEVENKDIYSDDSDTDKAFKEINPKAPFNLSDFLQNRVEVPKFVEWLAMRAGVGGNSNVYTRLLTKLKLKQSKLGTNSLLSAAGSPHGTTRTSFFEYDKAKAEKKKLKVLDICGNGVANKRHQHALPEYQLNNLTVKNRGNSPTSQTFFTIDHTFTFKFTKSPKSEAAAKMMQTFDSALSRDKIATSALIRPSSSLFKSAPRPINPEKIKGPLNRPNSLTHILYVRPGTSA
jgi:hypothetical protein